MSGKASNLLGNKILPLFVFPAITYQACHIMFGYSRQAGTFAKLATKCIPSTPYTLAYTGIQSIDTAMCSLVAFFDTMLELQHSLPFNVELLTGLAALAIVPYLEAARSGRNILLELHWVMAIIYQKMTGAVIFPLYWMIFVVTGAASLHRTPSSTTAGSIDQRHAESAAFTLLVAYILPSVTMLFARTPYTIAFWQAFPLWMFLAQRLYLAVRPASPGSGAKTVNAIYLFLFVLSAVPHVYLLTPVVFKSDDVLVAIGTLFLPSLTPLDPRSTTFEHGIQNFIQWDGVLMLASTFLATAWIAGPSIKRLGVLACWLTCSMALYGPGAAIVGVFWWRESLIGKESGAAESKNRV